MALRPFVNVICLIALYQYTDETGSLGEVRRGRSGRSSLLPWRSGGLPLHLYHRVCLQDYPPLSRGRARASSFIEQPMRLGL